MKWTAETLEHLQRRYPHEPDAVLASELGCPLTDVACLAQRMGLTKAAGHGAAHLAREAGTPAEERARQERPRPERPPIERRVIATGTLIRNGNVLTHLAHATRGMDGSSPNRD